jgi:hypothetical protein
MLPFCYTFQKVLIILDECESPGSSIDQDQSGEIPWNSFTFITTQTIHF